MRTIWSNICLNRLKLQNPVIFSFNSHFLLRNSAFYSCSSRKYHQILTNQTSQGCNNNKCLWGQSYILHLHRGNKAELGKLCSFRRQFHDSCRNVRYQEEKKPESLQEIVESTEKPQTALTVGEKVAQAGKDVSYFAIILAGFAVTGALLWYVFSELFLSNSPNKIYAAALKKVKLNEEVLDALGEPIKAYGEETARGRRRHVSFQEYIVGGENYMRVKFYVAGSRRKGTVHVDVKQVSSRRYEYRFIFVELEGFPPRTIIIEDNRYETD